MVVSQLLSDWSTVYRFSSYQSRQITVVLVVLKASFYVIGGPLKNMGFIGIRKVSFCSLLGSVTIVY